MSTFSKISLIVTIICFAWCIVLGLFVLVRSIINKVRSKKQMKQDLKDYEKQKNRKFGTKK